LSRIKRDTQSYLEAVKELAPFIPSLRKYSRRKKNLKPQEKAAIARAENIFAEAKADHLVPVNKRTARIMHDQLYRYEHETTIKRGQRKGQKYTKIYTFQGIQLRNTGKDVTIKRVNRDMFVTSNGRLWVYWQLPDTSSPAMRKAGREAFNEASVIDQAIELARKAFKNPETKGVFLWATSGRVGEGFETLEEFIKWIWTDYSTYQNTERFVKGIAFMIADVGDTISTAEWSSFGTPPDQYRKNRAKRRKRNTLRPGRR
jgi:hypothetical protein